MYRIIDRTDDLIVLYKLPGIDFHNSEGSLGLFSRVKKDLSLKNLYPIHRLDKETSGIIIMALTKECAVTLGREFEQKRVKKFYIAISDHKPIKKMGRIIGDMERTRRKQWKLLRSRNNPAITEFVSKRSNGQTIFLIQLQSGKTHQIRVALKSLSSPITGDSIYNRKEAITSDRCYLHSYSLEIDFNGKLLSWSALPEEGLYFSNNIEDEIETLKNSFNKNFRNK